MNKEEIEQGMKCCNEFLCGECPYEKYDDKESHQYTMRCIHMLMQDINKLYFDESRSAIENKYLRKLHIQVAMIMKEYGIHGMELMVFLMICVLIVK